jgi:hypothetical protein
MKIGTALPRVAAVLVTLWTLYAGLQLLSPACVWRIADFRRKSANRHTQITAASKVLRAISRSDPRERDESRDLDNAEAGLSCTPQNRCESGYLRASFPIRLCSRSGGY